MGAHPGGGSGEVAVGQRGAGRARRASRAVGLERAACPVRGWQAVEAERLAGGVSAEGGMSDDRHSSSGEMQMELAVTYDAVADAVYIYLTDIGPGEAVNQVEAIDQQMILDFDRSNKLVGIEILGARSLLPASVLKSAERI